MGMRSGQLIVSVKPLTLIQAQGLWLIEEIIELVLPGKEIIFYIRL